MNDLVALSINRSSHGGLAQSALPDAPVVEDGPAGRPARPVRRLLATALRATASTERRWAERLDPSVRARVQVAR